MQHPASHHQRGNGRGPGAQTPTLQNRPNTATSDIAATRITRVEITGEDVLLCRKAVLGLLASCIVHARVGAARVSRAEARQRCPSGPR